MWSFMLKSLCFWSLALRSCLDPTACGNSEKWMKEGNVITTLCVEKLSHCYYGYGICQILRFQVWKQYWQESPLSLYTLASWRSATLKISLYSLIHINSISTFECPVVSGNPPKRGRRPRLHFYSAGLPWILIYILCYGVRDLLVIWAQFFDCYSH